MRPFRSGDTFKLALGHGNTAGLIAFHRIHSRLSIYKYGFDTEYNRAESRVLGGDLKYKLIGLPWFAWLLPGMQRCAFDHVRDTYFNGSESVDVTVRTYNEDSDTFENYNAVMHYVELGRPSSNRSDFLIDVRYEFRSCLQL